MANPQAAPTVAGSHTRRRSPSGLILPGLLLGVGLGGFIDGILLHQILQWHHMLTDAGPDTAFPATSVRSIEDNTTADGLFHASTWILVAVGLVVLWQALAAGGRPSGRELVGLLLAGWGSFNLVEGVVDHQILGIHHVKADVPVLDLVFLAFGGILLLGGLALARRGEREANAG